MKTYLRSRFITLDDLRKMDSATRAARIVSIVILLTIGIGFTAEMFSKRMGIISIVPFLGFLIMAFEKTKNEKQITD